MSLPASSSRERADVRLKWETHGITPVFMPMTEVHLIHISALLCQGHLLCLPVTLHPTIPLGLSFALGW